MEKREYSRVFFKSAKKGVLVRIKGLQTLKGPLQLPLLLLSVDSLGILKTNNGKYFNFRMKSVPSICI